jgi:hypothetical protein
MVWRTFAGTMPKALLEKYYSHEHVLASYGIKIVKGVDIADIFSGKSCPPSPPQAEAAITASSAPAGTGIKASGKRVISERDLMLSCPESNGRVQTFVIGPKDILTPLAVDYATRMCITISRS